MKSALRHFNRGLVIGFEILAVFALLFFIALGVLLWRLSQGPLPVDFLVDRIEKSFAEYNTGFVFDVGSAQLVWGGKFSPVELEIKGLEIARQDKTPVVAVQRVGVQLSKRGILLGRIVPKVVSIYGPAVRVVRAEDGHFMLNFSGMAPETPVTDAPTPPVTDKTAILKSIIRQMQNRELFGLVGGLETVRVADAAFFYDDRVLNVAWNARRAEIVLQREDDGIVADGIVEIDSKGEKNAFVRVTVAHDWLKQDTRATVYFAGVKPSDIAQNSEALKSLADIALPLKGRLVFGLDRDFAPGVVTLDIGADPGTFNFQGVYDTPIKIEGILARASYDPVRKAGEISDLKINLGKSSANIKGSFVTLGAHGSRLEVTGELLNMPLDDLQTYWPHTLAKNARDWVTMHLSQGVADKATLEAALIRMADGSTTLEKLGGEIDFRGIKVDYFPPLTAVEGVDGKAFYSPENFILDLKSGKVGDVDVKSSKIVIDGFDSDETTHEKIDIQVSLAGPLKTALTLLDSKPLGYPSEMGLDVKSITGRADIDVSFKFPLFKNLKLADVVVTAQAKIFDAVMPGLVSGLDLKGATGDLSMKEGVLQVKGAGKLGESAGIDFDWTRFLSASSKEATKLTAQMTMDAQALRAFGVPADFKFEGRAPATVTYNQPRNGATHVSIDADLRETAFTIPYGLNMSKAFGAPARMAMDLSLRAGGLESIENLKLDTQDFNVAGRMGFRGGQMVSGSFPALVFGKTSIAADITRSAQNEMEIKVKGAQLDVSSFFKEDDKPHDDAEAAVKTEPLIVVLDVANLLTGENRSLANVKMLLKRNENDRIDRLEMDAQAEGKTIYLRYLPVDSGHSLRFEADDAGAALRALGITASVRGGKIVLEGQPNPKGGPRDLIGTAIMTNFGVKDAPLLAKLLNTMSLTGVMDLLNNKGIAFKKARVSFAWIDRDPPNAVARMIKLTDGATSGSSLGLTFEGNIDNWKNFYDLNGTIIPVSDINKVLSAIPLVGNILTGGGEGLIAATYTIKGAKSDPKVSVNPLAALAPGILRKIFFEQ